MEDDLAEFLNPPHQHQYLCCSIIIPPSFSSPFFCTPPMSPSTLQTPKIQDEGPSLSHYSTSAMKGRMWGMEGESRSDETG